MKLQTTGAKYCLSSNWLIQPSTLPLIGFRRVTCWVCLSLCHQRRMNQNNANFTGGKRSINYFATFCPIKTFVSSFFLFFACTLHPLNKLSLFFVLGLLATDACAQPPDSGSCNGVIPRFFNDFVSGSCKPFTYGGKAQMSSVQIQSVCYSFRVNCWRNVYL